MAHVYSRTGRIKSLHESITKIDERGTGKGSKEQALRHFELGRQLMKKGDIEGSIGACEKAAYLNKNLIDAQILMAEALVRAGYVDAAILNMQQLISVHPKNTSAKLILENAISLRDRRNEKLVSKKQIKGYTLRRHLGSGWEGAVYLAQDTQGKKFIIKLYFPHIVDEINSEGPLRILREPVKRSRDGLTRLSTHLRRQSRVNCDTLYAFDFLKSDDRIEGIIYSYEYLIKIQRRYLAYPEVPLAVVGAFLRLQAHLLRSAQLCLVDGSLNQFMIARTGLIRFVDYGVTLTPTDDFRCRVDHWEIIAFFRLLYQIFGPRKKLSFYKANVSQLDNHLDDLGQAAQKHKWLSKALSSIHAGRYDDFLDADFYTYLAAQMPRKLRLSSTCRILVFDLLSQAKSQLNHSPSSISAASVSGNVCGGLY